MIIYLIQLLIIFSCLSASANSDKITETTNKSNFKQNIQSLHLLSASQHLSLLPDINIISNLSFNKNNNTNIEFGNSSDKTDNFLPLDNIMKLTKEKRDSRTDKSNYLDNKNGLKIEHLNKQNTIEKCFEDILNQMEIKQGKNNVKFRF